MKFIGLFVGIDRYSSAVIDWLCGAVRDAQALHALSVDTLGGSATLLVDQEATRKAIEREMRGLGKCSEDDIVVVSFSGHGSSTHQLVAYDSDPADLAATGIPLELLTEWFSRIPSRRVFFFLDCCFSGGMGARVLAVDGKPRDMSSAEEKLRLLSGEGRVVFTAARGDQPAFESERLRHGLFTHHLMLGLRGAEEVLQEGKVSLYRLFEFVTRRVKDESIRMGGLQEPTLRGRIDGELLWPVFHPGSQFAMAFPDINGNGVTRELSSLETAGFPAGLIESWTGHIPALNSLQLAAIQDFGLLDGEHLVVSAPTSSGKTMIGELAAVKAVLERRRAIFLLPLKALVSDKYVYFAKVYGRFGIKVIRATGDRSDDIPDLMRGRYDICIMTYEKFLAVVLGYRHVMLQAGVVVVDEVQMISDPGRGVGLEFLLTLILSRRVQGIEPQLIALSAVIGATNGLERWLGARFLRREERPVPLDEGILRQDGSYRFINPDNREDFVESGYVQRLYSKNSNQDYIIPLARRLVSEGKQVIVFRETRGEARGCAGYLSKELGLPSAQATLERLPAADPSVSSNALRNALAGGVAFHTSDLHIDERSLVEQEFRRPDSDIRVLVSTTTLAMGVNTPAEAVVVVGLSHPSAGKRQPYSVAEYKNIVGRAGRLGFVQHGRSILLATTPKEELEFWATYVLGEPEALESQLDSRDCDVRSLVVRSLAMGDRAGGLHPKDVVAFLETSFGAFCRRQADSMWEWNLQHVETAIEDLERHGLVKPKSDGRLQLTELGWAAGHSGVGVESIVRLVETLAPMSVEQITDPALVSVTQLTVELDACYFPVNARSRYKEPGTWRAELEAQNVAAHVLDCMSRLSTEDSGTRRAKRAVACLWWITDTPIAQIEAMLTQFGGQWDGAAGAIRSAAARTVDILPTVCRVAELLHPTLKLESRVSRLIARMEAGVSVRGVGIAEYFGNRLSRADYLSLLKAGVDSLASLGAVTDSQLLVLVGNDPEKVRMIRSKADSARDGAAHPPLPLLPPYEG